MNCFGDIMEVIINKMSDDLQISPKMERGTYARIENFTEYAVKFKDGISLFRKYRINQLDDDIKSISFWLTTENIYYRLCLKIVKNTYYLTIEKSK